MVKLAYNRNVAADSFALAAYWVEQSASAHVLCGKVEPELLAAVVAEYLANSHGYTINANMQGKEFVPSALVIGRKVRKSSGKPFKSKEKVNTVKGLCHNLNSGRVAYTFVEDDSVVDCHQCKFIE